MEIPLAHAHFLVALFLALSPLPFSLSLYLSLSRPFPFTPSRCTRINARSSKRVHGRLRNGLSSTREVSARSCATRDDSLSPQADHVQGVLEKGSRIGPSRKSLGRESEDLGRRETVADLRLDSRFSGSRKCSFFSDPLREDERIGSGPRDDRSSCPPIKSRQLILRTLPPRNFINQLQSPSGTIAKDNRSPPRPSAVPFFPTRSLSFYRMRGRFPLRGQRS